MGLVKNRSIAIVSECIRSATREARIEREGWRLVVTYATKAQIDFA